MEWPRVGFKSLYIGFTYFNVKKKYKKIVILLQSLLQLSMAHGMRAYGVIVR